MKLFQNLTNTERLLKEYPWLCAISPRWTALDDIKVQEIKFSDLIFWLGQYQGVWARYEILDISKQEHVKRERVIINLTAGIKKGESKLPIGSAVREHQPLGSRVTHICTEGDNKRYRIWVSRQRDLNELCYEFDQAHKA